MPSTVVLRFSFDAPSQTLRITFVSGMVYEYRNVPVEIYEAMKNSGSKGSYFNRRIRDRFEFEKIGGGQAGEES